MVGRGAGERRLRFAADTSRHGDLGWCACGETNGVSGTAECDLYGDVNGEPLSFKNLNKMLVGGSGLRLGDTPVVMT